MEVNSAVVCWESCSSRSQGLGHAVLVWRHTQPQMWEGMRRVLTCSWFLPAGAWVQVLPSPELQEGQAVVLSCEVPTEALEGISYHWYRDGQPLQDSTSATLHFAAITLNQAGAYHCQAQAPGSASTSLAAPVSLHVSCKCFHPVFVSWGVMEPRSWLREGMLSPWSWALPP